MRIRTTSSSVILKAERVKAKHNYEARSNDYCTSDVSSFGFEFHSVSCFSICPSKHVRERVDASSNLITSKRTIHQIF